MKLTQKQIFAGVFGMSTTVLPQMLAYDSLPDGMRPIHWAILLVSALAGFSSGAYRPGNLEGKK